MASDQAARYPALGEVAYQLIAQQGAEVGGAADQARELTRSQRVECFGSPPHGHHRNPPMKNVCGTEGKVVGMREYRVDVSSLNGPAARLARAVGLDGDHQRTLAGQPGQQPSRPFGRPSCSGWSSEIEHTAGLSARQPAARAQSLFGWIGP